MNEEYLIHYGVLGMKWGVRKRTPLLGLRVKLTQHRQNKNMVSTIRKMKKKGVYDRKKSYYKQHNAAFRKVESLDEAVRLKGKASKRDVKNMNYYLKLSDKMEKKLKSKEFEAFVRESEMEAYASLGDKKAKKLLSRL